MASRTVQAIIDNATDFRTPVEGFKVPPAILIWGGLGVAYYVATNFARRSTAFVPKKNVHDIL